MSDPTTLTPPADAPLPWRLDRIGEYVETADGFPFLLIDDEYQNAARYLVACANAAPRLVKERDQWHQNCLDLIAARDTALARVAALEQALAYLAKLPPVVMGCGEDALVGFVQGFAGQALKNKDVTP
jgi:hypothetical protein